MKASDALELTNKAIEFMKEDNKKEIIQMITNAAARGQTSVTWVGYLHESVKSYLMDLGYSVTELCGVEYDRNAYAYIDIRWK